jgi:hypothetical protein
VPKVVLVPGFTQTTASWRDVEAIVGASCDVAALVGTVRFQLVLATLLAVGLWLG